MSATLPRISIETELGNIEIVLDADKAPVTTANFLRYVEEGFYNHSKFYRTVTLDNQPDNAVKIEVIQGGAGLDILTENKGRYPAIGMERTNQTGLKHLDGTISMARLAPDSATSEFFICIGDQPELDFGGARNPDGQGFAAFGQVVSGMEVVRQIQQCPAEGQTLAPPVRILGIIRRD
jgi:peptidyl-prolyl cis-trans isomerase A (cyclophilin A)